MPDGSRREVVPVQLDQIERIQEHAAVMSAVSDTRERLVGHLSLAAGHTLTMSPRLLAAGATLAPVKERSRVQVTLGAEVRHRSSSPWNDAAKRARAT